MTEHNTVKLLMTEFVTHDVKRFIVTKPAGFSYEPGQGVELAIKQEGWQDKARPFTPTGLGDDGVLEFTVKAYPDHKGVTRELHKLSPGAELTMTPAFGTIAFRGPGVFIAGGAGVTPFLAILRHQARRGEIGSSSLIFSNKTPADIIVEKELRHILGERCILTCTAQSNPEYRSQRIDRSFLNDTIGDFTQPFYVCGPPPFMDAVTTALKDLGADADNLVFEQ